MANIKRCDRCGKVYDLTDTGKVYKKGERLYYKYGYFIVELIADVFPSSKTKEFAERPNFRDVIQSYDLCPDCADKLLEFLKGEE